MTGKESVDLQVAASFARLRELVRIRDRSVDRMLRIAEEYRRWPLGGKPMLFPARVGLNSQMNYAVPPREEEELFVDPYTKFAPFLLVAGETFRAFDVERIQHDIRIYLNGPIPGEFFLVSGSMFPIYLPEEITIDQPLRITVRNTINQPLYAKLVCFGAIL